MKSRLSMLAREFTWDAFDTLLDVCKNGQSDSARIAATTALLDRGLLTASRVRRFRCWINSLCSSS